MKQYITVEQLNELTEEQKQRLREWWKPQPGNWFAISFKHKLVEALCVEVHMGEPCRLIHGDIDEVDTDKCLPLLSIGQCIKFLNENYGNGECGLYWYDPLGEWYVFLGFYMKPDKTWRSERLNHDLYDGENPLKMFQNELIDALWDAVKSIL